MALLGKTGSGRGRLITASVCTSVLFGCVLLQTMRGEERSFGFNHEVHVVQEEMDCSDCHMGVEDSDEPGIPPQMLCNLCHEDIDSDKDPALAIDQLFVDGVLPGPRRGELGDEVIFSHLAHVESFDCDACHGDVGSTTHPLDVDPVTMADCSSCHVSEGAPAECSTCHSEIDRDWAPESHERLWTRLHGDVARMEPGGAANDCSMCHTESACTQCHQEEPPADHNNFWRHRAHGLVASMDRQRCATCHQSDFCSRCHEQTEPRNHVGSFGGTKSNHCVSCHFPLESNSCATCHQGTPSHMLATPLPPGHTPGLDCRSCHPGVAPLPHADKGDACTLCHM